MSGLARPQAVRCALCGAPMVVATVEAWLHAQRPAPDLVAALHGIRERVGLAHLVAICGPCHFVAVAA